MFKKSECCFFFFGTIGCRCIRGRLWLFCKFGRSSRSTCRLYCDKCGCDFRESVSFLGYFLRMLALFGCLLGWQYGCVKFVGSLRRCMVAWQPVAVAWGQVGWLVGSISDSFT